jgi:sugar phosphate isomerase/epimerase
MKLSFTTMSTPGLGVLKSAKLAAQYGYDGIDLRISDYLGELNLKSSLKEINEVKNQISSEGIQLSGLLCYNKSGGVVDALWKDMQEDLKRHLELANILGSPSIRIFAGNPLEFENRNVFIEKTSEVIFDVLDYEKSEIKILLQNHLNGFTVKQGIQLAELIKNPNFGLVFSPDHCVLQNEEPEKYKEALKKYSKQLYMADLKVVGSEYICVLPGNGMVQLKEAFQALGGEAFEGWVTFKWEKIWHNELEEADLALPFFIEYFKRVINESF